MKAGDPMSEQSGSAYGRYEGSQGYSQQQYETPSYTQSQSGGTYDDNFIEALAQRIAQRSAPGSLGKLSTPAENMRLAGMRLALAIVSVAILVPISIVLMTTTTGPASLLALGMVCATVVLVNLVFNGLLRPR